MEEEARQMAEQYVAAAGPVTDPLAALLKLAGEIAGFKDYLAARVTALRAEAWRYEGEHAEQLRAEVGLYERALDRTARVLVDVNKLGLEERQVRLAEQQGELLAGVLRRIFDRLALTADQRALIPRVVPEELRRVAASDRAITVPSVEESAGQTASHRIPDAVATEEK